MKSRFLGIDVTDTTAHLEGEAIFFDPLEFQKNRVVPSFFVGCTIFCSERDVIFSYGSKKSNLMLMQSKVHPAILAKGKVVKTCGDVFK